MGSVSATCLTILAALLTLVCIRRSCLHRRRTFTYQSGSVSDPPRPWVHARSPCLCFYLCTHKTLYTLCVCVCVYVAGIRLHSTMFKSTKYNFLYFSKTEFSS